MNESLTSAALRKMEQVFKARRAHRRSTMPDLSARPNPSEPSLARSVTEVEHRPAPETPAGAPHESMPSPSVLFSGPGEQRAAEATDGDEPETTPTSLTGLHLRKLVARDLSGRMRKLGSKSVEKSKSFFNEAASLAVSPTTQKHTNVNSFLLTESNDSAEAALDKMLRKAESVYGKRNHGNALGLGDHGGHRAHFLRHLPAEQDRLKDGLVEKKNHEGWWQKRHMCLTATCLVFAREDSIDVIDTIHLVKVRSCGFTESKTHRLLTYAQGQTSSFARQRGGLMESLEARHSSYVSSHASSLASLRDSWRDSADGAAGMRDRRLEDKGQDAAAMGPGDADGRAVAGDREAPNAPMHAPKNSHSPLESVGSPGPTGGGERRTVTLLVEGGKRVDLRFADKTDARGWITAIAEAVKVAKDREVALKKLSLPVRTHRMLRTVHESYGFNFVIFTLILINYLLNALDFEFQPEQQSQMREDLDTLDQLFTWVLGLEVLLNLIVNWFWPFWKDLWNVFDVAIISVSFYGLTRSDQGSVSWLRIFRHMLNPKPQP